MWMDWDDDYYTFSDTNIEYIWRFLKTVHERGWLYQGHRSTVWCPRCGTSISQHEVYSGEYKELEHPVALRPLPAAANERASRSSSGRRRRGRFLRTSRPPSTPRPSTSSASTGPGWRVRLDPEAEAVRVVRGEELVGLEYQGPFDHLPAQEGVVHRVIPWDDVSLGEGTGIVHIAPGAGAEDFELSRDPRSPGARAARRGGPDAAGVRLRRALDRRRRRARDPGPSSPRPAARRGEDRPSLPDLLAVRDAARLPRRRRLVHQRRGDPAADARRERDRGLDARLLLEANGRLAAEHGRLEHLAQALLRPAAAVLPLRRAVT